MSRKYLTEKGNGYFSFRRYLGRAAPSYFCIVATVITDALFEQFLIRTAVKRGEHGRQRTVMDTSLSDIIERRTEHYYLMMWNAWVHQSVTLFAKKVNKLVY